MRILHVVSSLNVGGAERFVIDLAVQQKNAMGIDVGVISMGLNGEPLEGEVRCADINLHLATQTSKIRSILKCYDVVHIHSSHCLLRVLLSAVLLPIKIVYTRHNEVVHQGLKWKFVYMLASIMLTKIIFVAEKAKQNYLEKYPHYRKKTLTILNGVLPIEKNNNESPMFNLGHVGRFVPLKSQHVLIEAVALLPVTVQQKITISFYGTGELMGKNKALAVSLIPDVLVNFRGFEANRNVIYNSFDALIVTSKTEGLSLAIFEAFASGTPVIASNVGGNPELVINHSNGFLYDYGDSQSLANNIEKLATNNDIYQNFSEKCSQRYHEHFSMEICANNHLSVYKK